MTNEEAIEILQKGLNDEGEIEIITMDGGGAVKMAVEALEKQETGKWIEQDGWDGDVYYDCSICGESWTTIEGTPWENGMNYCPHCGAKMED